MEIGLILAPLIGAAIGYFTNYIAVKMLFRPYTEKRIGKFKVPFTPGIIPKGKPRIARAVANTVGETLLTEEDLKEKLLNQTMKDAIWKKCHSKLEALKESQASLKDFALETGITENPERVVKLGSTAISSKIMGKIYSMDLPKVAAEKIIEAGGQFLQSSFIGSLIGPGVLNQLAGPIEAKVGEIIETQGYQMISGQVEEELENLMNKPMGQLSSELEQFHIDPEKVVMSIYEKVVESGLKDLLEKLNIKQIIVDKIEAMEPKELEALTFAVMKKELNAIINLGALIGFILGCINILFLT